MTDVSQSHDGIDMERIEKLTGQIMYAIDTFSDAHHAEKTTIAISEAERLMALVHAIGFLVSSIDCNSCRKLKAKVTLEYLTDIMRHTDDASDEQHIH